MLGRRTALAYSTVIFCLTKQTPPFPEVFPVQISSFFLPICQLNIPKTVHLFPNKINLDKLFKCPISISVFFREQYVPFPENEVKEIGNKILSTFLLFPNSKSILEICLTTVYVNKLDFNNVRIIQLLSALKAMLILVHVIVFRQEKPRMFCQIKDAITQ